MDTVYREIMRGMMGSGCKGQSGRQAGEERKGSSSKKFNGVVWEEDMQVVGAAEENDAGSEERWMWMRQEKYRAIYQSTNH